MTGPAVQTPSVMILLRDSTGDLHAQAEGHAFQRAMVTGSVDRGDYVRYLQQMLIVHRSLESALRASAARVPAIAGVVTPEQYQEPYLLADLRYYEAPADVAPLPATTELVRRIEQTAKESPIALLGHHYVLEGSNNGSRFIARAIRKAFDITGEDGLRYLDPYGDRQREVWTAFKAAMDAQSISPGDAARMVEAAKVMFEGISGISEDVYRTSQ